MPNFDLTNLKKMQKILLVEDEHNVAEVIQKGLSEEGYFVHHVENGQIGLAYIEEESVDLIILDILLPIINGLEVCRRIKDGPFSTIPVLMLTALGSAENVALGLDSGADDYLAKPFKLVELKARIRNLLRRQGNGRDNKLHENDRYTFADLELNDYSKEVKRSGKPVSLTSTEYRLLLSFLKSPEKVLSRTDLLDEVWGINFDIGTNVVDVYVNYLRKKLDAINNKKLIHTVVGMGYVLKLGE